MAMSNDEEHEKESHQNDDQKLEVTLQGQTEKFSIKIETKTTISQLSSTIDKITTNILKSKSFSKDRLTTTETVVHSSISPHVESNLIVETPVKLFALKLGIDADKFEKSKLIGIRDKDIQIIKTSQISPLEAGMLILAIKDLSMNEKPLPYDDWKELCDANGIKSKTPFYKLAGNAKGRGYLDKSKHANKELLLTPKGIEFVKNAVENFLNK